MDGRWDKQKQVLKEMATIFGSQIKATKCSDNEVIYTYRFSFLKSLEYCIDVTFVSEKEWKSIVWPALAPSLQSTSLWNVEVYCLKNSVRS